MKWIDRNCCWDYRFNGLRDFNINPQAVSLYYHRRLRSLIRKNELDLFTYNTHIEIIRNLGSLEKFCLNVNLIQNQKSYYYLTIEFRPELISNNGADKDYIIHSGVNAYLGQEKVCFHYVEVYSEMKGRC